MTTQNENRPFSKASPVRAVMIAMIVGIIVQAMGVLLILSIMSQSNWLWDLSGVIFIVLGASLLVAALVFSFTHRVD